MKPETGPGGRIDRGRTRGSPHGTYGRVDRDTRACRAGGRTAGRGRVAHAVRFERPVHELDGVEAVLLRPASQFDEGLPGQSIDGMIVRSHNSPGRVRVRYVTQCAGAVESKLPPLRMSVRDSRHTALSRLRTA